MHDILEEIVASKRKEVAEAKQVLLPSQLHRLVEEKMAVTSDTQLSMQASLLASESGIIAEFKRRSPSKGWIKQEGRPDIIPPAYASNGAAALSILTDAPYFGGQLSFIHTARPLVPNTPILRKDFIIDEYQLFEARLAGANAVLLIAADLTKAECKTLLHTAHELGLEVLLEMHSPKELDYAELEPDMYGINNRNLGSFVTDVENSFKLAELLPADAVKVSESGISNPKTVKALRDVGFRGFLIGEYFMKTADPGQALKQFISQL